MNPVILIPSRLASVRLPNKPLADIAGRPMIQHVYERAVKSGVADVFVAADNKEVCDIIEKAGGKAVLTDPDHPSGSDRIFEALKIIDENEKYDVVINLQGDLPTIDPEIISEVLKPLKYKNDADISTLACKIFRERERTDPSVVKPVVAWDEDKAQGKALYFTRCPAPYGAGILYHHIGIYAYRREALKKFVALKPSPLEKRERLEQLRAIEAGMNIYVVEVGTVPLGVDTPEHLNEARRQLS